MSFVAWSLTRLSKTEKERSSLFLFDIYKNKKEKKITEIEIELEMTHSTARESERLEL
jgi:hypothetical protein